MVKVSDIARLMEEFAPLDLACDFDNVGLLVGRKDKVVKKILLALDADENTINEAVMEGADMIISHHPVIFNPIKRVNEEDSVGRGLLSAIRQDIAIYSSHTNTDVAKGGLNDLFAEKLGLEVIESLEKINEDDGMGRILKGNMSIEEICLSLKKEYNLDFVKFTGDKKRKPKRIAICTGGGRSLVKEVIKNKCDLYISGDLHYSDIRELNFEGCDFIEIGHFDSEKCVKEIFEKLIKNAFPEISIIISKEKGIFFNIL